jgi:hypothetical protein
MIQGCHAREDGGSSQGHRLKRWGASQSGDSQHTWCAFGMWCRAHGPCTDRSLCGHRPGLPPFPTLNHDGCGRQIECHREHGKDLDNSVPIGSHLHRNYWSEETRQVTTLTLVRCSRAGRLRRHRCGFRTMLSSGTGQAQSAISASHGHRVRRSMRKGEDFGTPCSNRISVRQQREHSSQSSQTSSRMHWGGMLDVDRFSVLASRIEVAFRLQPSAENFRPPIESRHRATCQIERESRPCRKAATASSLAAPAATGERLPVAAPIDV